MSEEQDTGSSAEDQETPEPKPEAKPEKKSKPAKAPDSFLVCSNHCGFNTRWPKAQALIAKGDKVAKEPYLCPQCDRNGLSGKLIPFG